MSSIKGKVAAVTGAGSGIGRELALGLARRGARLAVADVNEPGLAETVDQAKALGAEVHAATVDVADRGAVLAWADAVAEHYGVVHQIYNNAGVGGSGGTVLEADWSTFDRVLSINLWGVIHGSKAFLPHILASGDGHVINISSLNGIMAQANLSAYCSSKFAVRGFTESLRGEMIDGGHPVRITVVHPGGVRTNIAVAALEQAERDGVVITAEKRAHSEAYTEKLLKMPADKAATIILDGVEKNRPRVLVGNDVKAVDRLVRSIPRHYPAVAVWFMRRSFGANG